MNFILALWQLFFKSDYFSKSLVLLLLLLTFLLLFFFIYGYLRLEYKKKSAVLLLKKIQQNQDITESKEELALFLLHNKEKQNKNPDLFWAIISNFLISEYRLKSFFGIAASIGPLLGLLGTIWGIMNVFLSLEGNADLATIAPGISEALVTTLAGLFLAIPALCAYHFFNYLIKSYLNTLNIIYISYTN